MGQSKYRVSCSFSHSPLLWWNSTWIPGCATDFVDALEPSQSVFLVGSTATWSPWVSYSKRFSQPMKNPWARDKSGCRDLKWIDRWKGQNSCGLVAHPGQRPISWMQRHDGWIAAACVFFCWIATTVPGLDKPTACTPCGLEYSSRPCTSESSGKLLWGPKGRNGWTVRQRPLR